MIHIVGHTAIDHICRVPVFPEKNTSTLVLDRKVFFGGGAANIAAGIAVLGEKCTLVSAVGGDFAGGDYERWMQNIGILPQFFVKADAHTPTAFVFTDAAGDQITYFEWGASEIFGSAEAPALPFVHMATADPDFNVRVAEKSTFSSFDPGQDLHRYSKGQLDSILSHISILFANHHEVEGMCRILDTDPGSLAARVPLAVFTMGGQGSEIHAGGESEHVPALPVKMADPTGAGDAYRAGFLTAYVRGFTPVDCCRVGTVTASFVVEKPGCQTNLPTWDLMAARYSEFFGEISARG
ncbi:MAG: carbohydrate kinase family protein [Methanoregulaceae archaeon]|nr:carbohydrate kinase family protein [Methanoregulaceae archaeon]